MKKIKMILAVLIMAVLAIGCNNPSSMAKDYEKALKSKDYEKAAKIMEKAAEKYASWSSEKQAEFLLDISKVTERFIENYGDKAYADFSDIAGDSFLKLSQEIGNKGTDDWGNQADDWGDNEDDWGNKADRWSDKADDWDDEVEKFEDKIDDWDDEVEKVEDKVDKWSDKIDDWGDDWD